MAGAVHSVLFKAPRAQFVTLAGSSQANILYEMHFSRCLSEGSKQQKPCPFLSLQFPRSDSHWQNESIWTKWTPYQNNTWAKEIDREKDIHIVSGWALDRWAVTREYGHSVSLILTENGWIWNINTIAVIESTQSAKLSGSDLECKN